MIGRLLLLALPVAAAAAWRLGLLRTRAARVAAAALGLLILATQLPWHGVDFDVVKRANLLVAGATAVWLLRQHFEVDWAQDRRRDRAVLGSLAALAVVLYLNFFSFHGVRTFIHYHDVAHYYLGSKYFPELGYRTLYKAMLRAEDETFGRLSAPAARDLEEGALVPAARLLLESDEVRARFSTDRWIDFKQDVAFFLRVLGPQYRGVVEDHGFNPTPVWAAMGGFLANRVSAGSHTGILLLTLLDPLLLVVAFGAVARVYGVRAMLLAVIHFCLVFGATFGWTGGAFLRYIWFASVVLAVCLLERARPTAAGVLLALAATLRVFPALFLFGPLVKAAAEWRASGRISPEKRRLLAAAAGASALFLAATLLLPEPIDAWKGFRENMRAHMNVPAPNIVGLTGIATVRLTPPPPGEEPPHPAARQRLAHNLQLAFVFLPALALAALVAARSSDAQACVLAVPLALAGLNLASYYWVMIVLLTLVNRDRPLRLAALFGLELATYALYLFETNEAALYVERSLLLAFLIVGFYAAPVREALRALASARDTTPSGLSSTTEPSPPPKASS